MISCLIIGAFLILLGASFAFWTIQMQGSRKHIIKAVDMNVTLEEDNDGILISDAVPMYDEVGLIQDNAYQFRLVNHTGLVTSYILKLVDTTVGDKLFLEDVKLGITKNGESTVRLLSDVPESKNIDMGEIPGNSTIYYELRLWLKDTLTNQERVTGKSLSYKVEVEATDTKFTYLFQVPQGSYVAYVGNNGCKLNGTATTGANAESANSCKGYNANGNGASGGWCSLSSYGSFKVSGWRVAYTEGNRAYLISAGSPECTTATNSANNTTYINLANTRAKKYCNKNFVDGDCTNNSDVWAINNTDFNRITRQATGTGGGYLYTPVISGAIKCAQVKGNTQCGYGNTLIDNGSIYSFAAICTDNKSYQVYWDASSTSRRVWFGSITNNSSGLRPIIKLKSNVFVRSGNGTAANPYVIDTY